MSAEQKRTNTKIVRAEVFFSSDWNGFKGRIGRQTIRHGKSKKKISIFFDSILSLVKAFAFFHKSWLEILSRVIRHRKIPFESLFSRLITDNDCSNEIKKRHLLFHRSFKRYLVKLKTKCPILSSVYLYKHQGRYRSVPRPPLFLFFFSPPNEPFSVTNVGGEQSQPDHGTKCVPIDGILRDTDWSEGWAGSLFRRVAEWNRSEGRVTTLL